MTKCRIKKTPGCDYWEVKILGGMWGTDITLDLDENEMYQFIDEFKSEEEHVCDALDRRKVK